MATLTLNQPGEYRRGDFPALYTAIGSDGQKYFYATKEYINRGYVDNGQQHYPLFAIQHPKVFESASLVKLPSTEGLGEKAKQVYSNPTEGYLWKQSDLIKATNGVISQPFYQITADRPAIQGMVDFQGQPTYAVGATPNSDASFMTGDEKIINYRAATQSSGSNFLSNFVNNLVGGDIGKAFASIDPSRAISRELTNLYQPVEKAITAGVAEVSKALSTDDAKKAMAIAAAYYLPGVGAQLGQTLVTQGLITGAAVPYAAAIGTALASTGASVAQGVPFDTALTNATVNAVTSTGSQSVAGYISKLGASPEVANAITSVGASGLATAAKGGSAADIENNMKGALAGSAVTGLTGDKISGAVVGGQVTGGTTGALMGAAGAAGAEAARPAGNATTSVSGVDPGVQVAGGDDSSALNLARISAMPEMLGKAGETSSQISASTDSDGITAYSRTITGTTPDGKPYEYIVKYDPGAPTGKQIAYITNYKFDAGGELLPGMGVSATFKRPDFTATDTSKTGGAVAGEGLVILGDKGTGGGSSVSPADQKVLDLIKPTPTPGQAAVAGPVFTPATFTPATAPGRGVETDEERIARLDAQTARVIAQEADYTTRSRPGTGTGNATGNVVISDGGLGGGGGNAAGNVVVGPGDGGGGPGGNVTIDAGGGGGNATSNVSGNVVVDEPPVEEVAPPAEEEEPPVEEEKPPEEDEKPPEEEDKPPGEKEEPYKPDLFIYGGVTPKAKPRTRTNLGTTLQPPFAPSTTLGQALTGYRGAGEIEGKKTGKPRRDVWNEESLRLKDALGL